MTLLGQWVMTSWVSQYFTVTVGNSPNAPATLGIYQPLNWTWLVGEHTGIITTERKHIYHLIYNIYWDITSGHITAHGMALYDITSTTSVHQTSGGHLITSHYHRTDVKPLNHNCIHNLCAKRNPVSVMRFAYETHYPLLINYITVLYQ